MRKRTRAREFALQLLYQYEMNETSLEEVVQRFWDENKEAEEEVRSYAERLARGTVAHLTSLDETIVRYTENWHLNRMAVIDRNILRFAAYELLYLSDEIPPKVAINEAVNIAKKFSQEEAGKFVNGILDKINHTEPKQVETAGEGEK